MDTTGATPIAGSGIGLMSTGTGWISSFPTTGE